MNDHFIRFEREEGAQKVALKKLRPEDWEMLSVPKVRKSIHLRAAPAIFWSDISHRKANFSPATNDVLSLRVPHLDGGGFSGC